MPPKPTKCSTQSCQLGSKLTVIHRTQQNRSRISPKSSETKPGEASEASEPEFPHHYISPSYMDDLRAVHELPSTGCFFRFSMAAAHPAWPPRNRSLVFLKELSSKEHGHAGPSKLQKDVSLGDPKGPDGPKGSSRVPEFGQRISSAQILGAVLQILGGGHTKKIRTD